MFVELLFENRYLFEFFERDNCHLFMHYHIDSHNEKRIMYFGNINRSFSYHFWPYFLSLWSWITFWILPFRSFLVISLINAIGLRNFWSLRLQFRRHFWLSCWRGIYGIIRNLFMKEDWLLLVDCYRVFLGKEPLIKWEILHWCYRCYVNFGLNFRILIFLDYFRILFQRLERK